MGRKCRSGGLEQKGFSLLEVLISGAIMSTGLAGLAALLLSSVSGTAQAGHRTAATMLATGMVSQIQITPAAEQTFLHSPPLVIGPCDATHACTAQQFSAFNLKSWQLEVALRLPGGRGVVCMDGSPFDGSDENMECDGGDLLVVKVFWHAGAHQESSSARVVKIVG